MNDVLHEVKMYYDLPGKGNSERLEAIAKSITPALGLQGTSYAMQKWARNLGVMLEAYGLATIARKRDVSFKDGLSKHMFFFDDAIINAALILGSALAIMSNFDLLLPIVVIAVFYMGSDTFLAKVERL
mgnify:FL=1